MLCREDLWVVAHKLGTSGNIEFDYCMGPLAEDAWDLYVVLLLNIACGREGKDRENQDITILETGEEIESLASKSSSSKRVKTSMLTEKNRRE